MEKKSFKALLRRTVAIPIIALAILATVLLCEIQSLKSSLRSVDQTDQAISADWQLLKLILDMETGIRGYLSTGNSEFLQPYNEARSSVDSKFDALNQLVSDDPAQQARLAALRRRFEEWRLYANHMVESRRNEERGEINLQGKRLMDLVRAADEGFRADEERLRAERVRAAKNASRLTTITCVLLSMGVASFLAIFTRRRMHLLGATFQESLDTAEKHAEELRKSEAALRSSQARLQGIIGSAMDAVVSVDEQQRIVVFNRAAEIVFQCRASEAIGSTLDRFIPKNLRQVHREHIRRFGSEGITPRSMSSPGILVAVRANGEEFPIEATISQVLADGEKLYTVILRDITERKRAEKALRNSDRLATTGRVAATIAHEIRNPLDAVSNLLFLIGQGAPEHSTREYISMASQELARVTQITQQLLAFQREATKPIPVKIGEILESVIALYERKIRSAGINLKQQADFDGHILGLPGELRQMFANLVGNAIEAVGPRHGTITLRAYASRDWRRERPGLRVVVADDGPGIPAEVRASIFEPFFTTKGESGTGLGLWIASDILRKYDGTMRLRSCTQSGRSGTCFSVFFPFETSPHSRQ